MARRSDRSQESARDRTGESEGSSGDRSGSSRDSTSRTVELQRRYGNQGVKGLVERGAIQPRLTVGRQDSPAEREADRVARAVTRGTDGSGGRTTGNDGGERTGPPGGTVDVRRSVTDSGRGESVDADPGGGTSGGAGAPGTGADLERRIERKAGNGESLPDSERSFFASRMGRDFGDVDIHRGPEAGALAETVGAEAFTTGTDVFFGEGNYRPGTSEGRSLLAHELAHVAQQTGDGGSTPDRVQRQESDDDGTGSFVDRIRDRLDSGDVDGKAIVSTVEEAGAGERTRLAKNDGLLSKLEGALPATQFHAVCDALFESASDVETMKRIFEYRFDVQVGKEHLDSEKKKEFVPDPGEFGTDGLERIYSAYAALPASHVKKVELVVARGDDGLRGRRTEMGGGNHPEEPWVSITYDEEDTDETVEAPDDSDGDGERNTRFEGQNQLEKVASHEVGEEIYDQGNFDKETFRSFSGWKRRGEGWTVDELVAATGDGISDVDLTEHFVTDQNVDEKAKKIKAAARKGIAEAMDDKSAESPEAVASYWTNHVGLALSGGPGVVQDSVTKAFAKVKIFEHVADGHPSNEPWYEEPFDYLGDKQYHLPYTSESWIRYNTGARTDHKISDYQFRGPNEEFSELYALYYTDKSSVPTKLRKWFETEVDPRSGSGSTTGSGNGTSGNSTGGGGGSNGN